jgi:DNA-directed RNA polymerase subunit RPC12/RpoP
MSTAISSERLYSCVHCGAEYRAYPPDDIHSQSSCNNTQDSIEIPYHCANCGKENKLYWNRPERAT